MLSERVPIAWEGVPFWGFSAFTALVFALLGWEVPAVTALAVTAFVLYFFRDPERVVPGGPGLVVSPADGRVVEIVDACEGSLQGERVKRISIFMNVFNVHVNRSPVSGRVSKVEYHPGGFRPADRPKAVVSNERCALLVDADEGFQVTAVQVAGLVARRIVCRATEGDHLARGERFGLIRFGSRVDLYIPLEFDVCVERKERVRAGETVLARRPALEET